VHCEKCWRKDRPFGKMGSRVSVSSPLLDYRIKIPFLLIIVFSLCMRCSKGLAWYSIYCCRQLGAKLMLRTTNTLVAFINRTSLILGLLVPDIGV
jgi:hypothetical protein